jgi:uncharacterized protein
MAFNLYDAIVPNYQQILGSVARLLDKAEAFAAEKGINSDELVAARLYEDMAPFAFQVRSTATHSAGAIAAVRTGVFSPDLTPPPMTIDALRALIVETRATIDAIDPAEVNGFVGRDTAFEFGPRRMDFTAENFLLSFSQPNFYFHATTAYDILRMKGVEIGKRDFMGMPRLKG